MERKVNIPKKGAGRRLAEKLKKLGQQDPPANLVKKINEKEEKNKNVATPAQPPSDLEI